MGGSKVGWVGLVQNTPPPSYKRSLLVIRKPLPWLCRTIPTSVVEADLNPEQTYICPQGMGRIVLTTPKVSGVQLVQHCYFLQYLRHDNPAWRTGSIGLAVVFSVLQCSATRFVRFMGILRHVLVPSFGASFLNQQCDLNPALGACSTLDSVSHCCCSATPPPMCAQLFLVVWF